MAEIQILRVMNTDDDANGGGEILEYVTTVSKLKGTAPIAADTLLLFGVCREAFLEKYSFKYRLFQTKIVLIVFNRTALQVMVK